MKKLLYALLLAIIAYLAYVGISLSLMPPVADLARLPLLVELTGDSVTVGTCEVAAMSAGTMKQTAPKGEN